MNTSLEILSVKNLSLKFGGVTALEGVDMKVKRGTIHAIIGPNGAGKSCLFNAISGGVSISDGQIFYEGKEIQNFSIQSRQQLGISRAFQLASVFSNLSIKDNLRAAIIGREKISRKIFNKAESIRVDEISQIAIRHGLTTKRERMASQLSHAERQILDLAIAEALRPKLLLLDEPTQGVEQEKAIQIMTRFRNLVAETGLTIIMTEHDLNIINEFTDETTLLKAGQVVTSGATRTVVKPELVHELYL